MIKSLSLIYSPQALLGNTNLIKATDEIINNFGALYEIPKSNVNFRLLTLPFYEEVGVNKGSLIKLSCQEFI